FAVVARHRALLDGTAGDWWTTLGAEMLTAAEHPSLEPTLDAADADVVVVRPDRHVFVAGATLDVPPLGTRTLLGA
ncbi:MAG: hypothetical protein ACO23O_11095, partial [Ilumatobacteraceae bacterium]